MEKKIKPIQTEFTPELAERIIRGVHNQILNNEFSKPAVLHHLKQVKAQMGKLKNSFINNELKSGIRMCMEIIDKKISKVNKL